MAFIDLRSDTVTKPTPSMWKAMAAAEVGDDVYGDDPTVNRLEKLAAERMGKEAGLFVTSGTMGNLLATMTHCQRGDEVIAGKQMHIFYDEVGGSAALAGVMMNTLNNQPDGTLKLEEIREVIREDNIHFPPTRLIVLENTHSVCGGVPITAQYTWQVNLYRPGARHQAAYRRGTHLQCGGSPGRGSLGTGRAGGFGHLLPEQRVIRPGWIGTVREHRIYQKGTQEPQDAGRRDAPGRHPGCGRHCSPGGKR